MQGTLPPLSEPNLMGCVIVNCHNLC